MKCGNHSCKLNSFCKRYQIIGFDMVQQPFQKTEVLKGETKYYCEYLIS